MVSVAAITNLRSENDNTNAVRDTIAQPNDISIRAPVALDGDQQGVLRIPFSFGAAVCY